MANIIDETAEDKQFHYSGIYRAKVLDPVDDDKEGKVKVWIPDLMPEIEDDYGMWARPANNIMGGRNTSEEEGDQFYGGSCIIPPKNSWVWIFFETGDPSEPRYMGAGDFGQTKTLIECQNGEEWWKKWVLLKTRQGRCMIMSDDPFDERVEITGKKRKIKEGPDGDFGSVYTIKGNQTVILIDERANQEKILIKDHKGNFINVDTQNNCIDAYANADINIRCGGSLYMTADRNISITAGENTTQQPYGKISIVTKGRFEVTAADRIIFNSATNFVVAVQGHISQFAEKSVNIGANIGAVNITSMLNDMNIDGIKLWMNSARTFITDQEGNVVSKADAFVKMPSEIPIPLYPALPDGTRNSLTMEA